MIRNLVLTLICSITAITTCGAQEPKILDVQPKSVVIGEEIKVKVDNLYGNNYTDLRLYLNGEMLEKSRFSHFDARTNELTIKLEREDLFDFLRNVPNSIETNVLLVLGTTETTFPLMCPEKYPKCNYLDSLWFDRVLTVKVNDPNYTSKFSNVASKIEIRFNTLEGIEHKRNIMLFINDAPADSVLYIGKGSTPNSLIFELRRTKFVHSFYKPIKRESSVRISAGFKGGYVVPTDNPNFTLRFWQEWSPLWAAFASIIIIALGMFIVIKYKLYLNEAGKFSLENTQLIYWSFIIGISMIFLFFAREGIPAINQTVLMLLGLASGLKISRVVINPSVKSDDTFHGEFHEIFYNMANKVTVQRYLHFIFNLIFGVFYITLIVENYSLPEFPIEAFVLLGIVDLTFATDRDKV